MRLADALGTSVEDLAGRGSAQAGDGHSRPLRGAVCVLDERECRRLLCMRGIGRVAVSTPPSPLRRSGRTPGEPPRGRPGTLPASAAGHWMKLTPVRLTGRRVVSR
ncbi:hypothetical protein [Streptomyces sp. NPDC058157]|uniref:hypothetical protein n=1 Tax=Streptomyces sp. NPDC058157 TaxID=3346360 RepID=UPI0036E931B3